MQYTTSRMVSSWAVGSATKYPANICGLWSQAIGNAACQRPLFMQGSESERLEEGTHRKHQVAIALKLEEGDKVNCP